MTHFSSEDWVDFARNRVSQETEGRMQSHLESGCASCNQSLQVWSDVLKAAAASYDHSPPERGVRFAKALYHAISPRKAGLKLHVGRLVFPVSGAARPQERRDDEFTSRHFLFQRDNLVVDLHIEPQPDIGLISMVGQIMDAVSPSLRLNNRRVVLLSEKTELAHTLTNEFGEFHLEFVPLDDLILVIHLEEDSILVTPLPTLAPDHPAGAGWDPLIENGHATEL